MSITSPVYPSPAMLPLTPASPTYLFDPDFYPAALFNHIFQAEIERSGQGEPLIIGLERADGTLSRLETQVFNPSHAWSVRNIVYIERILKFLLWQRGGWKIHIGGACGIGDAIRQIYSPAGARAFDHTFLGETVYQRPFTVVSCCPDEVPPEHESQQSLGRHLDGCRIGFDLGASDIKVSAVIDGQAVFTHEMEWNPRGNSDPAYHYAKIVHMLRLAADKLPRLDAIGGRFGRRDHQQPPHGSFAITRRAP